MFDRMRAITRKQVQRIHDASMNLLETTGIRFNHPEALEIFKQHGIKVDGNVAFLKEDDVLKALETAPQQFVIHARRPANDIVVGNGHLALAPGYGAPYIMSLDGSRRKGLTADYINFCKLVQTSDHLDVNGYCMIEPADVPSESAHLDMLFSNIVYCNKPFMGSPGDRQSAIDAIEMASIAWGGKENIRNKPVMISNINSLSPLQFSGEMAASLIEFARYGQPCVIAVLIIAGLTGPVTMAGALTIQNAEILAGITLAQLVNPGNPVVYGSTSLPMDMLSGVISIGAPELSQFVSATAQLARFYRIPSRSGGSLTDAHFPDIQAGMESALILAAAVRSGINFVLHSCGILGSYLAMSYEKFIIDEELCGMFKKLLEPIEVTGDTISLDTIKDVGIGGLYVTHDKTLQRCRTEYFLPKIAIRQTYDDWVDNGMLRADQRATKLMQQRLESYVKPDIDPAIERGLADYVKLRKRD
ncbi:MAG: trimethylamine methyltransferase family protein [Deltaproteobacteria bacterium]|nr:MAG: trimethylamine methyltransferase family protein [Deltaproteobacteria bacterium]